MNKVLSLSDEQKLEIYNELSENLRLETPIAEKALNDNELYKHIIAHRRMFQAMKDFDYDTLNPATINIIPPKSVIAKWEDDYAKMRTMIYGKILSFSEIIDKIKHLNERINNIVW